MNTRIILAVLTGAVFLAVSTWAQEVTLQPNYVDPVNGLSLDQAIARALAQEPSLRAKRTIVDVARGARQQAALRPNPSFSVEYRDEPYGTDKQAMVGVEWPLNLFRRSGRIAVAEREITAEQFAVADKERLLAADVRTRYGEVLAAVRNLETLSELLKAAQTQHELLQSRVEQGASPPLERDLFNVKLSRLEAERLQQLGETEATFLELKRLLGMPPDAHLSVRDTLEQVVQSEPSPSAPDESVATPSALRVDVREAEARVDVAEAKIDRAEREGRFDVTLFGNYTRMDAGFPQQAFNPAGSLERIRAIFHYVSAGASFTLPLLNRNQGEVAAAQAALGAAEASRDAARLSAEAELAAARTRDEYAHRAAMLYGSGAHRLSAQNLSVVRQSYDLGRLTVFDVLAEERRYLDVERGYTEVLRSAYEARTALKRAQGVVR